MSGVLVAGTIGSASARVDPAAKAAALSLVPFLRLCLTRRAADYGHPKPGLKGGNSLENVGSGVGGGSEGESGGRIIFAALEEMISLHFPIDDSREPAEGSKEATVFAVLLRSLLSVFARCVAEL